MLLTLLEGSTVHHGESNANLSLACLGACSLTAWYRFSHLCFYIVVLDTVGACHVWPGLGKRVTVKFYVLK